jgi:abortive infection alpha-like protein
VSPPEEQGIELAKEGLKDFLAPVTDIMRDLLGPSATEIGLAWSDSFRVWRLKRVVRLLADVKLAASSANLKLNPVAPRLLFPILEAASLEDSDDLHTRWVALLTNAARIDFEGDMLPSFPSILKELTSEEAKFIDALYDGSIDFKKRELEEILKHYPNWKGNVRDNGMTEEQLLSYIHPATLDNLLRLMLLTRTNVNVTYDRSILGFRPQIPDIYFSDLAKAFVRACRVPKSPSAS